MTDHEMYVIELMWNRGFTCVDIAESLGYSIKWVYEFICRERRNGSNKFPYRHRRWNEELIGRPTHDEAEMDARARKVPERP